MSIPQPPGRAWFRNQDDGQWELRDEDHGTSMVAHRYAVVTDDDLAADDLAVFLANVAQVTGVPFPDWAQRDAAFARAEVEAARQAAVKAGQSADELESTGPSAIEAPATTP